MKILITGGAGYIGSHVNQMLLAAGFETLIYDNFSRGDPRAVYGGHVIRGDLGDIAFLDSIFHEYSPSAVMHFAAFTDVGESVMDPSLYYRNNVVNSLNLFDVMRRHHVNVCLFSSSAAVYGNPMNSKITESETLQPINPYGDTKAMTEQILQRFESAYGLKYCSLRYFNAAGGDPEGKLKNYKIKESNLIPVALKSLLTRSSLTIFGTDYPTPDGTCIRDYIHVYDIGTAHIQAMERLLNGEPSAVYNLGNGNGYSVKEVIKAIETVTKRKLDIREGPRRQGDPPSLVADASKAIQQLHWHPRYPDLESMVSHAWKALN